MSVQQRQSSLRRAHPFPTPRRRYAKLRGSPPMRSPLRSRRTDTLPFLSPLFILAMFVLSCYYTYSNYASSDPNPPLTLDGSSNSIVTNNNINRPTSSSSSAVSSLLLQPHLAPTTVRSGADYGDLCSADGPVPVFSKRWFLAVLLPGVIFCFVGLAIVTDDFFVAALEQICQQLDLSEDVAGATFMAAGSSTPEFFASMIGTFVTKDSVGIGTIVGSAVFNILVIIGLSAAMSGAQLKLDWRPLVRDSTFYVISIVLLFFFAIGPTSASNGRIEWWEGFILVVTYVMYVLFMAFANKTYMARTAHIKLFGALPKQDVSQGGADLQGTGMDIMEDVPVEIDLEEQQPQQPTLANVQSMSIVDGRKRYRDLNPRTKLRVAQLAVMATNRLASASSSATSGEDDGLTKKKVDNSDDNVTAPKVQGGNGGTGGDGKNTKSTSVVNDVNIPMDIDHVNIFPHDDGNDDGDGDDEGSERTFAGVELPTTIVGKVFFPFSFLWKLAFRYTILDCSNERYRKLWPVTFLCSVLWISAISYVMVEASRIAGCLLNIPSTIMGLTVLAAGTSVPDALASISVAKDGAGDMAVSNAIGSNVFDILLGLGFPWMLGNWILGAGEITVDTKHITSVVVPIIILFGIMVAFIVILIAFKWTMNKLFGYSLFALYFVFVAYTLLENFVFKFGE